MYIKQLTHIPKSNLSDRNQASYPISIQILSNIYPNRFDFGQLCNFYLIEQILVSYLTYILYLFDMYQIYSKSLHYKWNSYALQQVSNSYKSIPFLLDRNQIGACMTAPILFLSDRNGIACTAILFLSNRNQIGALIYQTIQFIFNMN